MWLVLVVLKFSITTCAFSLLLLPIFHRARTALMDEFTWCIRKRYDIRTTGVLSLCMAIAHLVRYLLSSTQGFLQGNFCKVGYL